MSKMHPQLYRLRTYYLLSLLFIFTFSCNIDLHSQNTSFGDVNPIIQVQYWGIEDGLSHRYVSCIHQDKSGLMWFGTGYGLNRFDGYEFKWFTEEKHGLQNNQIDQILEDQTGRMWLFHTGSFHSRYTISIDLFDPLTEEVTSFEETFGEAAPFAVKDIQSFNKNKLGHLVFVTSDKLVIYTDHFQVYPLKTEKLAGLRRIHWTDDGLFWLVYFHVGVYNKALTVLDSTGNLLHRYDFANSHYLYLWDVGEGSEARISDFKKNNLKSSQRYLTLKPGGRTQDDTLAEKLFSTQGITQDLTSPFLKKFHGHYWTLTAEANFVLVPELEGLAPIILSEQYPYLKNATSIFQDDKGEVWVSSEFGIFRIKLEQPRFHRILHNIKDKKTGELTAVRGMVAAQNSDGKSLFAMVESSGQLIKIDLQSGEQKIVANMGDHRWALAKLPDEQLIYVGPGGIHQISAETGQMIKQYPFQIKADAIGVSFLHQDKNGKIWYSNRYRRKLNYLWNDQQITLKNGDNNSGYFYQFHENETDTAWVGSNHGLFKLNIRTDEILERYWKNGKGKYHLPFDHVLHFLESEEGTFWLGTSGGGLLKWTPDEGIIERYTRADGLPDNTIYAVYPDSYGNLWLPTDYGICAFNPKTKGVKSYTTKNGLSHNEFNRISHCTDDDGNIYFGSLNGITAFHPDDFIADTSITQAPLVIIRFQQYDDDDGKLVDKTAALRSTKKIILQPNTTLIHLQFSLLTMENMDNVLYAYQLDGVDENWTYQQDNNIRFGRLPYGNHTLLIKGQAAGGQWSDQMLRIQVESLRPFYLRSWFIFSAIGLLLGSSYLFYRQREKTLKARQKKLENIVKDRTSTIEKQKEELKSLDEMKSRFFTNISHEFRTPLTLILGKNEQLQAAIDDPKLHNGFEMVGRNGHRLLDLVNQVLDVAKIEAGGMELKWTRLNAVPFLKHMLYSFESMANEKGIDLAFESEFQLFETAFDPQKIERVIFNLLSNAIKFTPEGGKIRMKVERGESMPAELLLTITDSGVGIKASQLPYIFDRFYQADSSENQPQPGTGIGLSLVKELVELHGGTIRVTSELNQGTAFHMSLPVPADLSSYPSQASEQQLSIAALPSNTIATEQEAYTTAQKAEKILLIEDNPDIRAFVKEQIVSFGYGVEEAKDGVEGLEKAQEMIPDLIISDIMMPRLDGYGVAKGLKIDERTSHIPVVLLTSKASDESKLAGLELGIDDYLLKPFNAKELEIRIANLIEQRKRLRKRFSSATIIRPNEVSAVSTDQIFLKKVLEAIESHLADEQFGVEQLADHAGMSVSHLNRKLSALLDQTAGKLIRSMRLQRAVDLLVQKAGNITEIAYDTGFNNHTSFYRSFKKQFGMTPTEYQQKHS